MSDKTLDSKEGLKYDITKIQKNTAVEVEVSSVVAFPNDVFKCTYPECKCNATNCEAYDSK